MKLHYGWLITAVCMAMLFGTSMMTTGMAVNFNAMRSQFGFSGTEVALINTIYCATALAATFAAGRFYERLGLRKGMTVAALAGTVAFVTYYLAGDSIAIYYIGAIFVGLTYSWGMILPASVLMQRWFASHRALALGICSAGTAISSMVMPPIIGALIASIGIRDTFLTEALLELAIAALLFAVIRERPEDVGSEPYHKPGESEKIQQNGITVAKSWILVLIVIASVYGMCGSPITSSFVLNFTSVGMDPMAVATGMSVFGFTMLFGKIAFGEMVDRKGSAVTSFIFASLGCLGLLGGFAIGACTSPWLMYMSFALIGLGMSLNTLGYPNWAADFSKPEDYAKTVRVMLIGFQLGALLMSPIPGIIADVTGDYTMAYLMFAILFISAAAVLMVMYSKLGKLKKTVQN